MPAEDRQAIDEKLAGEMVHLVLRADGIHAGEIAFERPAVAIMCPPANLRRPQLASG